MDVLDVIEELVHLLFAVACGFTDDQIGKVCEGAVLAYGKPVGAFNKWADVFREMLLRCCIAGVVHAAKGDSARSRCVGDFKRAVRAQVAYELAAIFLECLYAHEAIAVGLVEFIEFRGQIDRCGHGGVLSSGVVECPFYG